MGMGTAVREAGEIRKQQFLIAVRNHHQKKQYVGWHMGHRRAGVTAALKAGEKLQGNDRKN